MLITHQHPKNKSIMVAILGKPNVGKSSLINYFLGFDLSIVTHKPQTTRNRFHCNTVIDKTEIVFVDTPGIHKSNIEFNKRMNQQARDGSAGADLNLILIDLTRPLMAQVKDFKEGFTKDLGKSWMIFTKADLIEEYDSLPLEDFYNKAKEEFPSLEKFFVVSSKEAINTHTLTGAICDEAQFGPHLYPNGAMSNKNVRFFVCEYIREQAFELLKEEIPYEVAVTIDHFMEFDPEERSKLKAKISATILVNRPSQRAIVVGSKGSRIKEIGTNARAKIEELMGGQIALALHVKVKPKWMSNNYILEELGLPRAHDSNRVWRQK